MVHERSGWFNYQIMIWFYSYTFDAIFYFIWIKLHVEGNVTTNSYRKYYDDILEERIQKERATTVYNIIMNEPSEFSKELCVFESEKCWKYYIVEITWNVSILIIDIMFNIFCSWWSTKTWKYNNRWQILHMVLEKY